MMNRLIWYIFALSFFGLLEVGVSAAWDALTEQEEALVGPYARGRLLGPGRLNPGALEAAGEYCRDKGVDFRTALPGIWVRNSVLFAGLLPARRGGGERQWGVLYTDEGLRGEIPWQVRLIVLHPRGKGPRPTTPEDRANYFPMEVSFESKQSGGYGIVPWLENVRDELSVVVLDQGRCYAAIRPWLWQTVTKVRVRAEGIERIWEKGANMHEVNWVTSDVMLSFSKNSQRPQVIREQPVAAPRKIPVCLDPAAQLQREVALITPYARTPLTRAAGEGIDVPTRPALLEAAGEYCRAKDLNFDEALPRIWSLHSVVMAGGARMGEHDEHYRWAIVYRECCADSKASLRLSMIHLTEENEAGAMGGNRRSQPLVHSIVATGFRSGSTILWPDSDNGWPGIVVLQQTEPSAKYPWYRQSIAHYRMCLDGFTRAWKETAELHAVNFVPIRELMKTSYYRAVAPCDEGLEKKHDKQ